MSDDEFTDETHGKYDEQPHADIMLTFTEWADVVSQVLEYQLGPPIAWEYDGGVLFLWGDELTDDLLREIADACNELEQQYSRGGHYEAAQAASHAARQVLDAEVSGDAEIAGINRGDQTSGKE